MDNTIIQQGSFTSDGNSRIISLRSDVDWMRVYNLTEFFAQNNVGVEWYWQREFAAFGFNSVRYQKTGGTDTLEGVSTVIGDFELIDSSTQTPGINVAVAATTNATPVVVTAAPTTLVTGSIVRLNSITNAPNIAGFDFEVDNIGGGTFDMRWNIANAPGAAGGAGFYRIIPFDPIFYPRNRFVIDVTVGATTEVLFSVTHGYTVGQQIRFTVPELFSMVELDGLEGTITAVNTVTNTVTVDIDSTAFTAFTFPTSVVIRSNWAQAVPMGINTAQALTSGVDILADATENLGILGMRLFGGQAFPAGANNDQITWVAGKSFNTGL